MLLRAANASGQYLDYTAIVCDDLNNTCSSHNRIVHAVLKNALDARLAKHNLFIVPPIKWARPAPSAGALDIAAACAGYAAEQCDLLQQQLSRGAPRVCVRRPT
jgi:hypothetical protein